jgi:hypothetical protein
MKCRDCQKLLTEYVDGALSEREVQAVRAHLAGCPNCQTEEKAVARILSEARGPLPEPGDLFWINFLPRVRERIFSRPEPWYGFLFKPSVGWGSLSLATLLLLAGIMVWRMAPVWYTIEPSVSPGDYLGYETGYPLDEHLAQVIEASKDQSGTQLKVFEKLSPVDLQSQVAQFQQGDDENLDNLIEGLTPEQEKALETRLMTLEEKAMIKEG